MISTKKFALCLGMIISFLTVSVYAQPAAPKLNRFAVEAISFDYPDGYSVKDESTPEVQQFTITREGSSVQLTIVIPLRLVTPSTYQVAVDNFTRPMVTKVAMALGEGQNSPEHTSFQTQIGAKQGEGVRLRSISGEKKITEVIWLRWSLRLVEFVFVKSDADESVGAQLWETVSSSLRVAAPVINVKETGAAPTQGSKIEDDLLNGRAISLGRPGYPPVARAAHASGTVRVAVIIDEQGNVIAARAVDGHPLLQAAAVSAARQSRFSRTLLEGEPVRVTGMIKYKFVAQ